jgi:hypothetical protein
MKFQPRPSIIMALTGAAILAALAAVVWLPRVIYPPLSPHDLARVASGQKRIELQQAQAQIQNNFRSQLVQCLAGLVVVVGAAAGWQQLRIARDGHITERYTRAIDHLGNEAIDVRLGGIYALERVAKNSPADRPTVAYTLGAFIRHHAPWPVGAPDGPQHPTPTVDDSLAWLSSRAADVQTAFVVLGRRPENAAEQTLYLSRVDLRRAHAPRARLAGAILRYANLAQAYMVGADLEMSQLFNVDLRRAHLRGAKLAGADLRRAHLGGADLREASLRAADLRGADLSNARLDGADLTDIRTDEMTIWST